MSKKNAQKKEFTMSREEYIEHLSMKSNEVHMTTKNSKTGCGVIDLAFPVITCREDAPCKKGGCYCCKGTQVMATVQGAYYRNYRIGGCGITRLRSLYLSIARYLIILSL